MAAALGVRFSAPYGRNFFASGATLGAIRHIALNPFIIESGERIEALCDVTNPLCGPTGSARVFGPQKGATPEMVETMEAGMAHLATIFERNKGPKLADMPCAGAAGGCGAAGMASHPPASTAAAASARQRRRVCNFSFISEGLLTGFARAQRHSLQIYNIPVTECYVRYYSAFFENAIGVSVPQICVDKYFF